MKFHSLRVATQLRCVLRGKLTEPSPAETSGQLMRRIVPSNFSLVTRRTRRFNCFLLGAGNSSIHVEATLDPLSRSRPYNTHQ